MYISRFILFLVFFFSQAFPSLASDQSIDQAKIFDWWDDGLVTAEEASELLDMIQDGNFEEACLLSQALALETCAEKKTAKSHQEKLRP